MKVSFRKQVLSSFHFLHIRSFFCNIINVFTVTFDQCNAPLLNKSINPLVYCMHFDGTWWIKIIPHHFLAHLGTFY